MLWCILNFSIAAQKRTIWALGRILKFEATWYDLMGSSLCTHQDVVDFDCVSLCIAWKINEKPSPVSGIANVRHIECCKLDVKELKYIDLWRLVRHSSLPEIYVPVTHLLNTLLEYQKESRTFCLCFLDSRGYTFETTSVSSMVKDVLTSDSCWQCFWNACQGFWDLKSTNFYGKLTLLKMLFKFSSSGSLLAFLATVALLLDGSSAQEVTTTTIKSMSSFAPASGVCFSLPVVLLYFLSRFAVMYRTSAKHSNTITCRHLLKC